MSLDLNSKQVCQATGVTIATTIRTPVSTLSTMFCVQLQQLRAEFDQVDTDHNGVLSLEELRVAFDNVSAHACLNPACIRQIRASCVWVDQSRPRVPLAHDTIQSSLAKSGELDVEALFRNISADEHGDGIRFRKVDSRPRGHALLLVFGTTCSRRQFVAAAMRSSECFSEEHLKAAFARCVSRKKCIPRLSSALELPREIRFGTICTAGSTATTQVACSWPSSIRS